MKIQICAEYVAVTLGAGLMVTTFLALSFIGHVLTELKEPPVTPNTNTD